MGTYSFMDVQAALVIGGVSISLGDGSGAAEEGITVAMVDDKNVMTIGADGEGMHSLRASKAGTITVRLLKTSPVNQQLSLAYNLSTSSSLLHGKAVMSVADPVRGDLVTARGVAFAKQPDLVYAAVGNANEWVFHAIKIDELLGQGSPSL